MPEPFRSVLGHVTAKPTTNAALWFEVFPREHKQEAFGNHYEQALRTLEAPEAYPLAYEDRLARLRKTSLGVRGAMTRLFAVQAAGRFIVGLGAASASETGIQLLRPWGVPYLPGSSLKGVASAAAHARGDDWGSPEQAGGKPGKHHETLFGSVDQAGAVIFHDAWWIPSGSKLPFALDVMTPHHKDYNGGETTPPLDTDSPTPVSFLTCTGSYLVALTGPADWLELAWKLLEEALTHHGVGGKTAAGYGRFELDHELEDPEVVKKRSIRAKLQGYVDSPPDAGARDECAMKLLEAREALGDAEVAGFLGRIAASDSRGWKKWLRQEVRVERFGWLADLVYSDSDGAPETVAVEESVKANAYLEMRPSARLSRKAAKKAKKKRHLVVAWTDGERVMLWTELPEDARPALASHLSGATKSAPKPVRVCLVDGQITTVAPPPES